MKIESLTVTDEQFLLGARDGRPVTIGAELRLPGGTGRAPTVVLLHGSGGIGANIEGWAAELNALGIAALVVDSFGGRGITQTITDQTLLSNFSMMVDTYRALEVLAGLPEIDPARIAVMGFSKGGFAALYSSMRRFQRMWGSAAEFAAYVAFYTRCDAPLLEDEDVSERPIRLFHGTADDYVPVGPTREYVERLRSVGKDAQLTVYEGARHVFDNPRNAAVVPLADAMVSNNCRRAERGRGTVMNVDTGKAFSWSDSCVTRGASIGYHQQAHVKATKDVREFFRSLWRLPI
jgi:dienelactone hydrolase